MGNHTTNCTIAVDAMGGDKGPEEFVRGLSHAIEKFKLDCSFVLVGKERLLERLVKAGTLDKYSDQISLCDATQVIEMAEKPVRALKNKKDSSMVKAIGLLKDNRADAMVSCGNTGALMAGSTLRLRQIPGIDRPALGIIAPSKKKPFVMLDVGANPESNATHLIHNAILGSNYAKAALDIDNPKVALLTIGTEEGKGNALINQTHSLLQKINGTINYKGLIEGFQLYDGNVDVVVFDGFVGNILLKSNEAAFKFINATMREELMRSIRCKIGALLSKPAFNAMKSRLGPDRYAGAPLLGLRGNVLKTHGSANYVAIANALRIARELVAHDMLHHIESDIAQANEHISESGMDKS